MLLFDCFKCMSTINETIDSCKQLNAFGCEPQTVIATPAPVEANIETPSNTTVLPSNTTENQSGDEPVFSVAEMSSISLELRELDEWEMI
jgi:hypothetical protein